MGEVNTEYSQWDVGHIWDYLKFKILEHFIDATSEEKSNGTLFLVFTFFCFPADLSLCRGSLTSLTSGKVSMDLIASPSKSRVYTFTSSKKEESIF